MKHHQTKIAIIFCLLLLLVACHSTEKTEGHTGGIEHVAYKIAKNYYLRANVVTLPTSPITSHQEFESLFGMATTMGDEGRPTPIDFEKEAVLAVTFPSGPRKTDIQVERLVKQSGRTLFSYKVIQGDTLSYEMKPVLILIVKREDVENTEFRRWLSPRENTRAHYTPTPQTGVF